MSVVSVVSLPTDIWTIILGHVIRGPQDVIVCALVCKYLNVLTDTAGSVDIVIDDAWPAMRSYALDKLRRMRNINRVQVNNENAALSVMHDYRKLVLYRQPLKSSTSNRLHTLKLHRCIFSLSDIPPSVTKLDISASTWISAGGQLNTLQHLRISSMVYRIDIPNAPSLLSLSLTGTNANKIPYLSRLHTLKLPQYLASECDISAIGRMTSLTKLRLTISFDILTHTLTQLLHLGIYTAGHDLSFHPMLTSLSLYAKVDWTVLNKLRHLRKLKINQSCPIVGSALPTQITKLCLIGFSDQNHIYPTNEDICALTGLRALDLTRNYVIGNAGVSTLTSLTRLRTTAHCPVSHVGLTSLTNLRTLKLDAVPYIDTDAMTRLCPWVSLRK